MVNGTPAPARSIVITTEKTRDGFLLQHFRFVAVDRAGAVVAASESFDSGFRGVIEGKREWQALNALLTSLRLDGWVVDLTPQQQPHAPWYAFGLRSGDGAPSPLPQPVPMPTSRAGNGTLLAMWAITLLIVVLLFGICVVLALTAHLEIRPIAP